MAPSSLSFLLLFCSFSAFVFGDGFVEEVACSADSLTVVLNRSDPDLTRWLSNSKSQPMVYVKGHKSNAKCGAPLRVEGGNLSYNLTIPYGHECDVLLADLEPSYRTAETTIALEDITETDYRKTIRVNHVFCLYQRSVQTIRFNDIQTQQLPDGSTGGKPKAKVEMVFKSLDGRDLRTAKMGDMVEFYVALSPDNAYKGITPKECMFSDREDMLAPEAKRVTFVSSNCPVREMNDIIDPLANVNEEIYFSKFRTFRFGNQSTIFAHCTVEVCLNNEECTRKCFKKVSNSSLNAAALRRFRRSASGLHDPDAPRFSEIKITKPFDILDSEEVKQVAMSSSSVEQCLLSPDAISRPILVLIAVLALVATVSLVFAVVLSRKLRAERKLTDVACGYGGYYGNAYSTTMAPALARHYSTASLGYYDKANWPTASPTGRR
ncbi:hypothetical protein QR680_017656 [Steinernema hermaphroditum]|uniref:ZP domain-containing protein n=1 Tax=Steinernema hermaphroditum TaxID=289476 RepID=A0AA39HGB7_9BILA|nr:hypothetical protein QR680_017656 [Steinernema hermaphroditum]